MESQSLDTVSTAQSQKSELSLGLEAAQHYLSKSVRSSTKQQVFLRSLLAVVCQWKRVSLRSHSTTACTESGVIFAAETKYQSLGPVMSSWPLVYPSWWCGTSPIPRLLCWVLPLLMSIEFVCCRRRQLMKQYPLCFVGFVMNIPRLVLPNCQLLKKFWTRCMPTSTKLNMEEMDCGRLLFSGEQYGGSRWSIKLTEGLATSSSYVGRTSTTSRTLRPI